MREGRMARQVTQFLIAAAMLGTASSTLRAQGLEMKNSGGNPAAFEVELSQVGGKGPSLQSVAIGTLRCDKRDAIVGVQIKQGPVLDYIRPVCAEVTCDKGACGWVADDAYDGDEYAGNPDGGTAVFMECPPGLVVAGFEGVAANRNAFVGGLRVACGKVASMQKRKDGRAVFALAPAAPVWAERIDAAGDPVEAEPDPKAVTRGTQVTEYCKGWAATGLSVAVAPMVNVGVDQSKLMQSFKDMINPNSYSQTMPWDMMKVDKGANVIQAFSMFCAKGP
ncbi:MAG: hypothetical protein JNM30_13640 [Rhodospirillales bacterium]|nr:hypothetical protein [Rhodospirillales bacterium]